MTLKFRPHFPISLNSEGITKEQESQLEITVGTNWIDGKKSHQVFIMIDIPDRDDSAAVWINLNRNEARYLMAGLTAYLNEEEIDIEAED